MNRKREPFTIEVGANMKTLDQLVIDTIAQNLQSYKVNAPTAAKIASEIREWMRKQNGGLRDVIGKTLNDLVEREVISWVTTSPDPLATDAILSVIPPPRDEMFQSAIAVYESRIRELETEVERLANLKSSPECCDKATKYDVLRERFPYLPGDEFWTYLQGAIRKWSVCEVWIGGEEILCKGVANGKQSPVYRMHECHHTADACRAAIPVEE